MAVVTATVNREYDAAHRPRVLAWMSAAWIIPGLVAPPLAGCMAETLGWRWVFLGVLPLVGLAAALSLPGLGASACTGTGDAGDPGPARFGPAFGLVAGVSIVLFALGEVRGVPAAVLLAAGGTLGVQALGRIVPAGKRSPVVTTRLLLTFGFFGADVFLPLALTDVRDTTASVAGALMMVSAVCWSMGAFCHARLVSALVPRSAVTIGAGGIAIGIVGEMVALDRSVSLQVAFWSWAIAGLGMGFAYNATGVTAMGSTPRGHEGETSSALGVADSLGYALAAGIGGAVLAWGERGGHSTLWALSVTWVIMLVACLAAGVVGQRIGSPCSRRSRGSRMVESASLDIREMETPGRRGR
jgi:MFS family permease